tara:strand:+ start:31757 stop:32344 length:588 start_codon:yes stop_codon:yes gene_type:complete
LYCNCEESKEDFPNIVVSRGNPHSRLMIIGEAPGREEALKGKPFVGRAGRKLDYLLEKAGINPNHDIFICNAVKCRPPKNRRPTHKELKYSEPWLIQQIELVDPFVIILAGSTAVHTLLKKNQPISSLRGTWQSWKGRLVMPIFHPAYLLRNPSLVEGSPNFLTESDLLEVAKRVNSFSEEFFDSDSSCTGLNQS